MGRFPNRLRGRDRIDLILSCVSILVCITVPLERGACTRGAGTRVWRFETFFLGLLLLYVSALGIQIALRLR